MKDEREGGAKTPLYERLAASAKKLRLIGAPSVMMPTGYGAYTFGDARRGNRRTGGGMEISEGLSGGACLNQGAENEYSLPCSKMATGGSESSASSRTKSEMNCGLRCWA